MISNSRRQGKASRRFALLGLGLGGLWTLGGAGAGAQQEPASAPARKEITIGDIAIRDYKFSQASPGFSGFHISGSNTEYTIPDKASRSVLVMHADDVTITKVGADPDGALEMSGHLRYTITQSAPGGARKLTGVAGHASYRKADHKIRLTNGFQASILDPERLDGPANLRSDTATIDLSAAPYRYTLEGAPTHDDVRFTPRGGGAAGGRNTAHIFGFASGDFQAGKIASFHGGNITSEFVESAANTLARLYSDRIDTRFSPDGRALSQAEATGHVRYYAEQRAGKGKTLRFIQGAAGHAFFLLSERQIRLTGGVVADLTDRAQLKGPGTLRYETARVDLNASPYRYTLEGAPDRNRIRFTLRGRNGHLTEVELYGNETVTGQPGKAMSFQGANTSVELVDPVKKTLTRLQSKRIDTQYEPDGKTLARLEADGPVRYYAEQPSSVQKPAGPVERESVQGVTGHALYTADDETLHLTGGFTAKVTDEALLVGPGTVRSENVVVSSQKGYDYTLTGTARQNDVHFTLRDKALEKKTADGKTVAAVEKKTADGKPIVLQQTLHVSGYETGVLQVGRKASFTGPSTTGEWTDPNKKSRTRLQSKQIDAQFAVDGRNIARMEAAGPVRYYAEQPASSGKTLQSVTGTAGHALYVQAESSLQLTQGVKAQITDEEALVGPGVIEAANVAIDTADKQHTLYTLTGTAQQNDLRVTLRDKAPEKKTADGKTVAAIEKKTADGKLIVLQQTLHVSGYETGVWKLGEKASFTGFFTVGEWSDPNKRSHTRLQSRQIDAQFAPDGKTLVRMEAAGPVRYEAKQPSPSNKVWQSVTGTAGHALYIQADNKLQLTQGVEAQIVDEEELDGPGAIHAASVTVDAADKQHFLYTLTGPADQNDLRFTLRKRASEKQTADGKILVAPEKQTAEARAPGAAEKQAPTGPEPGKSAPDSKPPRRQDEGIAHAYAYDTAIFQAGEKAEFQGTNSTLDYADPDDKTQAHIQSEHIEIQLAPNSRALTRTEATGSVRFHIEQPTRTGKSLQAFNGTASHITYVTSPETEIDVQGPMTIEIVDPESLEEPGHIVGKTGDSLRLIKTDRGLEYLTETPNHTMTEEFLPRHKASAQPTTPANGSNPKADGKKRATQKKMEQKPL